MKMMIVVAEIVVSDFVLGKMIEEKACCFCSEYLAYYLRQEYLHWSWEEEEGESRLEVSSLEEEGVDQLPLLPESRE